MCNILFSSVGRRSYLVEYFRQAMRGRGKIIGANCWPDTPGMHAVDVPLLVPKATAAQYMTTMLDICKTYAVKLLFSLHDFEASVLSESRDLFSAIGTQLMMPSHEHLNVCLDKHALALYMVEHGLVAPHTVAAKAGLSGDRLGAGLTYPVVVKPRFATGSIGLSIARSDQELALCLARCQRAIEGSQFRDGHLYEAGDPIVVQERINGPEYGLNILNDLNGRFMACFVIRKLGMRAGETDAAETVRCPMLEGVGQSIGRMLKHPGLVDVDVIVEGQKAYVIDLNPRFGGHYPFAHAGGANAPAAIVAWMQGRAAEPEWLGMAENIHAYKDISIVKVAR